MRPLPPLGSMQARRATWDPSQIVASLLAAYGPSFTDDGAGDECSSWHETVAAKHATASGTARPTIIYSASGYGKDVLDFDGSSDYLFTSPSTITGGVNTLTLAWIGHADSVSGVRKIVETGTGGAGSFAMFLENAKLSVYAGGAAGQDYVAGNTTISTTTRYLFVVEIPFSDFTSAGAGASNIKMWVSNSLQTHTIVGENATNTTMGTKTWIIGRWISAGAQYWDGRMGWLRAWGGALTGTERSNLYAWAQANYGVA